VALVEVRVVQVDADEAQQQPVRAHAEDFPEAVVDGVANFFHKPRLRGWIHVYSAVVAFIAGAALV
jgi:hemolysin III